MPSENEIPISMYEAKKTLSTLGMEYEKIYVCSNDCILYCKEFLKQIVVKCVSIPYGSLIVQIKKEKVF